MRCALPKDWRWGLAAWALYAAISIGQIGHGASLTHGVFGSGSDPFGFVWLLAWYPWALARHQSLLTTHLLWQPLGVPLLWISSVPLLCLSLAPLTHMLGPVVVYNLLILAAPVLSGGAAYSLCRRVGRDPVAALLGGYVFGFSSYEMAADLATPNLSFTFLLPCLVILALRRCAGEIGRASCVALAALMMVAEFFVSIEVFATLVLFGAVAWALAFRMLAAQRAPLRALLGDAVIAGAIALLVLAPFLVEMLLHLHYVKIPKLWPYYFVSDPLNVIVPTILSLVGGGLAAPVAKNFPGIVQEQGAYLGLPLVLIFVAYAREAGGHGLPRLLLVLLLVFLVASFGPQLWLAGKFLGIPLPWMVFVHLPLIGSALPARFTLYVSLVASILLTLWIVRARERGSRNWRLAAGIVACLALLPAPHAWTPLPVSRFFAPGEVQAQLGADPQLLILPYGLHGPSTFWQEENHFGFSQSGGYLGFPPAAMQHYAVIWELTGNRATPEFPADLERFCNETGARFIVAGPGTPADLLARLAGMGWRQRAVDDVTIFTVPEPAHG